MLRYIIGAVVLLCGVCPGEVILAADIRSVASNPLSQAELRTGICTHYLEGEIVVGDVERFQSAVDSLGEQFQDDLNFVLCMNSPGGNLAEGLELGQLIKKYYFGTYVPEDSECLSACAIAFMHGQVALWEVAVNHRMIHPTAVLGFHSPKLDLPDISGPVPMQLVDAAYRSAIGIIAQLMEGASDSNQSNIAVIPLTLVAEMLRVWTRSCFISRT